MAKSQSKATADALSTFLRDQEAFKRREITPVELARSYEHLLATLQGTTKELRTLARKLWAQARPNAPQ